MRVRRLHWIIYLVSAVVDCISRDNDCTCGLFLVLIWCLFSVFFLLVFIRLFFCKCVFLIFDSFTFWYSFHNLTSFIISDF